MHGDDGLRLWRDEGFDRSGTHGVGMRSRSANTGTPCWNNTPMTVPMSVNGVVITSSPGPMPAMFTAMRKRSCSRRAGHHVFESGVFREAFREQGGLRRFPVEQVVLFERGFELEAFGLTPAGPVWVAGASQSFSPPSSASLSRSDSEPTGQLRGSQCCPGGRDELAAGKILFGGHAAHCECRGPSCQKGKFRWEKRSPKRQRWELQGAINLAQRKPLFSERSVGRLGSLCHAG